MIDLVLALVGALTYVVLYYQHVRKYPKGPLPLPLIGNLYHLNPDNLHEYLHRVGKEYGHCLTLFMPRPVVVFTDYTTIKEALITHGEHFAGRSHLPPESLLQKVDQTGILVSDGEIWREQRRASLRILREHGLGKNIMEAQVNRSIDEMLDQLKAINDGVTPFDMNMSHQDTSRFRFFIDRINEHFQLTKDNIWVLIVQSWPWTKHLPLIGTRGYKEPVANISKYQDFIESEVNKVAKTYDTSQEPTNFVQSMVNLYAIVVDFWLARMETTSTTLRWSLLLLMKNYRVQDKMREELLAVVGRDRRFEMSDKPNLPYLNAAITEIQRTANMIPFLGFHRCTVDYVIGGKFIPEDTLTMPQIFSVMKDDAVFERPTEFLPERFLDADGKTANKKQVDRMIQFGMGKRQ